MSIIQKIKMDGRFDMKMQREGFKKTKNLELACG
jgi:hypothetical protein